tara:strand:+ start:2673 stop:2891 length:219 start_codon:yes stop_codon:yes gene_type:complete
MNKADYIHLFKEACADKCNAEFNPCIFRQAADSLAALKPVGFIDKNGILFNDTTHPQLHKPLYSLEADNEST